MFDSLYAQIAFLQSSAESPGILLLFQELFHSPLEKTLSPGEAIADLMKTCHAKNLSDAIGKFMVYVVRTQPQTLDKQYALMK